MKLIFVLMALLFAFQAQAQTPTQFQMQRDIPMPGTVVYKTVVGQNFDIDTGTDPEDVWVDSLYDFLPDSGKTLYCASSSAADTNVVVTFTFLDTTGALTTETFSLNGKTHDTLSTRVWRVLDMEVGTAAAVGAIAVSEAAGDSIPAQTTNIKGYIEAGYQNSHMGFYTIANDYEAAYLDFWEVYSSDGVAQVELWIRHPGGILENIDAGSAATGYTRFDGKFLKLNPKTDILIRVREVGTDNSQVTVRIGLILYDKS